MLSKEYNGSIYFECDGRRCAEVHETGTKDFREALDSLKEAKWTIRRDGETWKHYCCDEDIDDSEYMI